MSDKPTIRTYETNKNADADDLKMIDSLVAIGALHELKRVRCFDPDEVEHVIVEENSNGEPYIEEQERPGMTYGYYYMVYA